MARTTARCISCGTIESVGAMVRSNPLDRGGRNGYLCSACARRRTGYYTPNAGKKGKVKSEKWTISIELETSNHTATGHGNLLHNGFIPTRDSSLGPEGVEYKSPIYQGFGGLVKYTKSIEKMLRSGDIEIDRTCGHHIHIGRTDIVNHLTGELYDINAEALDAAWKFRYELLSRLGDYLLAYAVDCRRVFGRSLSSNWAATPHQAYCSDRRTHDNRYCFINLCTEGYGPVPEGGNLSDAKKPEYAKTIELRVSRFLSAEQYAGTIMLWKKMVQCIITNFWDFWKAGYDAAILDRQAELTGQKLVRLVKKAAQAAREREIQ